MARISLSATGFYKTPKIHWDAETNRGRAFYYFAYGAAVSEVVEDWLAWIADLVTEPPEGDHAWEPSRLEYRFSVAATVDGVEHTLVAEEYVGGHLDWYAFDAQDGTSLAGRFCRYTCQVATPTPKPAVRTRQPA